jgi:hypothetical protein
MWTEELAQIRSMVPDSLNIASGRRTFRFSRAQAFSQTRQVAPLSIAITPNQLISFSTTFYDATQGSITFVGAFKNATAVYQCSEAYNCYLEPDIFDASRIDHCKRYWSDAAAFPTPTASTRPPIRLR